MMKGRSLWSVLGIVSLVFIGSLFAPGAFAAKDKVINLKFANYWPSSSNLSQICEEFIKDLEMRTDGRIKVKYFPGGSLLKGPTMYKGIETGIADIGLSNVYYTPGRMLVTEAGGMPLGYPSAWVSSHVLNDFYHKVKPKEWDKVKLMWFFGSAPDNLMTKKPIEKLQDLQGLTVRAPGVPGEIISALDGTPAPTPIVEVYDALAKGVLDGSFTAMEAVKSFRLGEVVKYVMGVWQLGNTFPFYVVMNKNKYNQLPSDVRESFDTLCGEYKERFCNMWNQMEFQGKDFGLEKDVKFVELSNKEAAEWKNAVEPVIENYVKKMKEEGYAEAEVRGWISFLRERIEYYTKKQIEYRLPSPTGPEAMRIETMAE